MADPALIQLDRYLRHAQGEERSSSSLCGHRLTTSGTLVPVQRTHFAYNQDVNLLTIANDLHYRHLRSLRCTLSL